MNFLQWRNQYAQDKGNFDINSFPKKSVYAIFLFWEKRLLGRLQCKDNFIIFSKWVRDFHKCILKLTSVIQEFWLALQLCKQKTGHEWCHQTSLNFELLNILGSKRPTWKYPTVPYEHLLVPQPHRMKFFWYPTPNKIF